jgi:DNA polymerase III epsilon subunit-like protein
MPEYKAHNALMDAIATAELFLALANKISAGKKCKLGEFLS